eukprot:SM000210S06735  [mRNA]  locus=s210:62815:67109:- [translate_table: standard]
MAGLDDLRAERRSWSLASDARVSVRRRSLGRFPAASPHSRRGAPGASAKARGGGLRRDVLSHGRRGAACGAQLLEALAELADRVEERAQELTRRLRGLDAGARAADVRLRNARNRLRNLADTQFLESRVSEDDNEAAASPQAAARLPEPAAGAEPEDVERPTAKARLRDTVQECARAVDVALTRADMLERRASGPAVESSADAFLYPRAAMILDEQAMQPLPYIAGSERFQQDTLCGLSFDDGGGDGGNSGGNRVEGDCKTLSEEDEDDEGDADEEDSEATGGRAQVGDDATGTSLSTSSSWSSPQSDEPLMATRGTTVEGVAAVGNLGSVQRETQAAAGGLEPAVTAALNFKAMLEAALRRPPAHPADEPGGPSKEVPSILGSTDVLNDYVNIGGGRPAGGAGTGAETKRATPSEEAYGRRVEDGRPRPPTRGLFSDSDDNDEGEGELAVGSTAAADRDLAQWERAGEIAGRATRTDRSEWSQLLTRASDLLPKEGAAEEAVAQGSVGEDVDTSRHQAVTGVTVGSGRTAGCIGDSALGPGVKASAGPLDQRSSRGVSPDRLFGVQKLDVEESRAVNAPEAGSDDTFATAGKWIYYPLTTCLICGILSHSGGLEQSRTNGSTVLPQDAYRPPTTMLLASRLPRQVNPRTNNDNNGDDDSWSSSSKEDKDLQQQPAASRQGDAVGVDVKALRHQASATRTQGASWDDRQPAVTPSLASPACSDDNGGLDVRLDAEAQGFTAATTLEQPLNPPVAAEQIAERSGCKQPDDYGADDYSKLPKREPLQGSKGNSSAPQGRRLSLFENSDEDEDDPIFGLLAARRSRATAGLGSDLTTAPVVAKSQSASSKPSTLDGKSRSHTELATDDDAVNFASFAKAIQPSMLGRQKLFDSDEDSRGD